jgi:ssDNA-binding Zn-finger/Zn-ribbon topoisomerase 1
VTSPKEDDIILEGGILFSSLFGERVDTTPVVEDVTIDDPLYPTTYACERRDLKCGECGSLMSLRKSPKYKNPFYGCTEYPQCKGSHGAHPDGRPLGIPANKATKQARINAHIAFDHMWKTKKMRRYDAYAWLSQSMRLPMEEAHIGRFTVEQCEQLIALVRKKMKGNMPSIRTLWDRLTKDSLWEEDGLDFPLGEDPH